MLNKKAQEINPGGALMGVIGGIAAFVMARAMEANIIYAIIITGITAVVCYFIASGIGNN